MTDHDPASALIADALPELRDRIERRVTEYGDDRNWEKLRAWDIAEIATGEAAVAMVQLAIDLYRESMR